VANVGEEGKGCVALLAVLKRFNVIFVLVKKAQTSTRRRDLSLKMHP